MKKAFLDQLFLGFLLLMGVATFIATVSDETSTRNRIYDLKDLARTASNSIARHYEQQIDMCEAQEISEEILKETELGEMLLEQNLISYTWYDTNKDGQPDRVTTTIAQHNYDTFWYRLFDKFHFSIGPFNEEETVTVPVDVTLTFGSEDAGYNNMMGTYQLDANNCVTNAQLLLQNSNAGHSRGDPIGSSFTSPPTFVFLLSEGYDTFNNSGDRPTLSDVITVNNHCIGNATSNPSVTLNGITEADTNMYFEHTTLNGDGGYPHFQLIPDNVLTQYESFIAGTNANQKYQLFLAQCASVNNDNDPNNNIPSVGYEAGVNDCLVDRDGEYSYAMEDIDGGGDQDFNDLMLDATRVVISSDVNDFEIDKSEEPWKLDLTCDDPNQDPILTLQGCPLVVNEDTTSNSITWTATDSDGTISSVIATANNGSAVVNNNGTISYLGNLNYYGNDDITVKATDNDGGITFAYCTVTITEINDIPTITGTAENSVLASQVYSFTPIANDVDSDVLTFSIQNKPSWLNFDTSTGTLSGIALEEHVGTYSNITISVSDGRGGSASLTSFSIEVITNNGVPFIVTPIADQTAYEDNTYTYDISSHFDDPDGDSLTYTISGGASIGTTNGVISYAIPDGTAGNSITLTITASDGQNSVSDNYVLTIISNSDCNGPFEDNFTGSTNDWDGTGEGLTNSNRLRINGTNKNAYKSYFFGDGCKNIDITLTFFHDGNNRWDNGNDTLELYVNETLLDTYTSKSDANESYTVTTDNDGWVLVNFINKSNNNNERARIDNIKLEQK